MDETPTFNDIYELWNQHLWNQLFTTGLPSYYFALFFFVS